MLCGSRKCRSVNVTQLNCLCVGMWKMMLRSHVMHLNYLCWSLYTPTQYSLLPFHFISVSFIFLHEISTVSCVFYWHVPNSTVMYIHFFFCYGCCLALNLFSTTFNEYRVPGMSLHLFTHFRATYSKWYYCSMMFTHRFVKACHCDVGPWICL